MVPVYLGFYYAKELGEVEGADVVILRRFDKCFLRCMSGHLVW